MKEIIFEKQPSEIEVHIEVSFNVDKDWPWLLTVSTIHIYKKKFA